MWTSFGGAANLQGKKAGEQGSGDQPEAGAEAPKGEIDELKAQLSAMQQRIERLAKDRE